MDEQEKVLSEILNLSARLLSQNRPDEAIEHLVPLYEQHPHNADVAINLGGAYILQRKWNRAVAILQPAARRHETNAMLWTNLAAAYLGRLETSGPQHQERAIRAYERALAIDPQTPNVNYHLGLIYKERGELLRAITFFERALEVNPADKDALYWIQQLDAHLAEQHGSSSDDEKSS